MTLAPTMKIVARDVPPTGTLSSGTGNASASVVTARSAPAPARVLRVGPEAAYAAAATTTAAVPRLATGRTRGRSRVVSRSSRRRRCSVDPFVLGPTSSAGRRAIARPFPTPGPHRAQSRFRSVLSVAYAQVRVASLVLGTPPGAGHAPPLRKRT